MCTEVFALFLQLFHKPEIISKLKMKMSVVHTPLGEGDCPPLPPCLPFRNWLCCNFSDCLLVSLGFWSLESSSPSLQSKGICVEPVSPGTLKVDDMLKPSEMRHWQLIMALCVCLLKEARLAVKGNLMGVLHILQN